MESSEEIKIPILSGIERCCKRTGLGAPSGLFRLTGGATMESWRFMAGGNAYVLRRAPSAGFMKDRPFGHDVEAAIIRAAYNSGVSAPEVVAELVPEDDIGSGFVMRALPGTPNPKEILQCGQAGALLEQAAHNLARIHSLVPDGLPHAIPALDYQEGIAGFKAQFDQAGGDRPIIALGIRWLQDNCAKPVAPVLNHGDFRMGNLLAEGGQLTGVLDWELAHFGDYHEDLAFGCMAVWRFARIDRPALGLGSLTEYFAAYEAAGGGTVDPVRFRFWMIYRTVWWALGCLQMAQYWRSGEDRMLERVVISRRTSEQELDLLMLLEEEAPEAERMRALPKRFNDDWQNNGEASIAEIATAISEWLSSVKHRMDGHDRFQLAVARNALGIIGREMHMQCGDTQIDDDDLARYFLSGDETLASNGILAKLKFDALEKVQVDSPKYPALAIARKKWTGKD